MQRNPKTGAPGKLRIIAGTLRNSRLPVADIPGLRPTPERVRETLFNWLAPHIEGARCLDLYAGTGALGIEALSRGAAQVDLVERDTRLAALLKENLARLKAAGANVYSTDAASFMANGDQSYDIVFVDPPFADQQWNAAMTALESHALLKPGALVYLEYPQDVELTAPASWSVHRQGRAGAVCFTLYRREAAFR
jgi:16S rRNA (guanine966-N2)-methyltransferase